MSRRGHDLDVVFWNAGHKTPDAKVEARIRGWMSTHQVGIFAEMGGRSALRNRLARDYGLLEGGTGKSRVLIVWHQGRIRRGKFGFLRVQDREHLGEAGAGPAWSPRRFMPFVRLYDTETRRWFWVFGKHVIASNYLAKRRPHAKLDMRLTGLWARAHRGAMLGGADWNFEPGSSLINPVLRLGGLRAVPRVLSRMLATHGNRAIDWFVFRPKKWFRVVSQRVLPGNQDDHDAMSVRFLVVPR